MVNIPKLRGKIVERGTDIPEVAKRMGVNKATLYRRIADGDTFTIGEARKIAEILGLSHEETVDIFWGSKTHDVRLQIVNGSGR